MTDNLNPSQYRKNELDLGEIIDTLVRFKKLFISTVLIFTISSIVYTFNKEPKFQTTAIYEIGNNPLQTSNEELIEPLTEVISNLKIYKLVNELKQDISFTSIHTKKIKLVTESKSIEDNDLLLKEVISDTFDRHKLLFLERKNYLKNKILSEIDFINNEVSFIKSKLFDDKNNINSYVDALILNEINFLQSRLLDENYNPTQLEQFGNDDLVFYIKTQELNDKDDLFRLQNELSSLQHQLEILNNQDLKNKVDYLRPIKLKSSNSLIIILSLITGVITAIFLVFFNIFIIEFRNRRV